MDKYSSGLVSESFWFIEFKKFMQLRYDGNSWDTIKSLCLKENLLGISKEYRAARIYKYLKNRVESLEQDIYIIFLKSDLSTQKTINLFAVLKRNRLFFEFLYEVYREKNLLGVMELSDKDINIFFKHKQQQNEDVAVWADVTLKRLRSSYINFMIEAGLLKPNGKQKLISPPVLDVAFENYLKSKGEIRIIKAITGVD